jgi:hypothetical protein
MEPGNQQFNYHYNREERLKMPNAPKNNYEKSNNILKKNKSLAIILIDIVIFVIVFSVIKFFFILPSNFDNNNGYSLTLSGFSTNEEVIVRVKIEKKENDAPEGNAEITFTAEGRDLDLSEVLPKEKGEYIEITDSIKISEKTDHISASVMINNELSELSLDLDKK